MTEDLSLKTMDVRRKWYAISKVLNVKSCQPKCYTQQNVLQELKMIKAISNGEKLREYAEGDVIKNGYLIFYK